MIRSQADLDEHANEAAEAWSYAQAYRECLYAAMEQVAEQAEQVDKLQDQLESLRSEIRRYTARQVMS